MLTLAINLISQLTYLGIFIGTFIEGPLVGLLAGSLVRTGFLNLFFAYLAHVAGDLSADFFYYFIGQQSQRSFLKKLIISERHLEKTKKMKRLFHRHPKKIIILGKLTHLFGLPILLGVGMSDYPRYKFLFFDFIATLIKSALLIALGYYLMGLWPKANNVFAYLNWFGILVLVLVLVYFIMKEIANKLFQN